MTTSAAKSYHLVSELRLLMSLNSRRSMEGFLEFQSGGFDPSRPPIFDVYQDEDANFNPELPPFFEEIQDDFSTHNTHASVFSGIQSGLANIPVLFHLLDPYSTRLADLPKNIAGSPIMLPGSLCGKLEDTLPFFYRIPRTSSMPWNIIISCHGVHGHEHIKLVFDPGGLHRSKNRDDSFFKKGSMIRVGIRVNEGTSSLKVGNQFNCSRE